MARFLFGCSKPAALCPVLRLVAGLLSPVSWRCWWSCVSLLASSRLSAGAAGSPVSRRWPPLACQLALLVGSEADTAASWSAQRVSTEGDGDWLWVGCHEVSPLHLVCRCLDLGQCRASHFIEQVYSENMHPSCTVNIPSLILTFIILLQVNRGIIIIMKYLLSANL